MGISAFTAMALVAGQGMGMAFGTGPASPAGPAFHQAGLEARAIVQKARLIHSDSAGASRKVAFAAPQAEKAAPEVFGQSNVSRGGPGFFQESLALALAPILPELRPSFRANRIRCIPVRTVLAGEQQVHLAKNLQANSVQEASPDSLAGGALQHAEFPWLACNTGRAPGAAPAERAEFQGVAFVAGAMGKFAGLPAGPAGFRIDAMSVLPADFLLQVSGQNCKARGRAPGGAAVNGAARLLTLLRAGQS